MRDFSGFGNFKFYCPLCGGVDCPRFLGTYIRKKVISFQGTCYVNFPIARFRCRQRGRKNPSHKTFSLLPYELIPYSKYSINFVFQVLTSLYIEGKSQKEVLDFITTLSRGSICLESSILPKFKSYIIQGIEKLVISRNFRSFEDYLNVKDKSSKIISFLSYVKNHYSCSIRGPCLLSRDFYIKNGSYKSNSEFLFGTPSQYRF